jgi:hypothetical protein
MSMILAFVGREATPAGEHAQRNMSRDPRDRSSGAILAIAVILFIGIDAHDLALLR